MRKKKSIHEIVKGFVQDTAGWSFMVAPEDAAQLLRNERARVRRLVRDYRDRDKLNLCRKLACDDILNALKEGR